jgi:hypothetical protein
MVSLAPSLSSSLTRRAGHRHDDIIHELGTCAALSFFPTALFPLIASYAIPLQRIILVGGNSSSTGRRVYTLDSEVVLSPTLPFSFVKKMSAATKSIPAVWMELPELPYAQYISSVGIINDMIVAHGTEITGGLQKEHKLDVVSLDISPLTHGHGISSIDSDYKTQMKSVWYFHCQCAHKESAADSGNNDDNKSPVGGRLLVADATASTAIVPRDDASLGSTTSRYGGHGHTHIMPNVSEHRHGTCSVSISNPRWDTNDGSNNATSPISTSHIQQQSPTTPTTTTTRWYIFGGFGSSKSSSSGTSDVACYYDSRTNEWVNIQDIPSGAGYAAACVYQEQIYLIVSHVAVTALLCSLV